MQNRSSDRPLTDQLSVKKAYYIEELPDKAEWLAALEQSQEEILKLPDLPVADDRFARFDRIMSREGGEPPREGDELPS